MAKNKSAMSRIVRHILVIIVIALVGYKSVYFKRLSTYNKQPAGNFDAVSFSQKLWNEQLLPRLDSAIGLGDLIDAIKANPSNAFEKYSNALAIGNYRYSLVKFTGTVAAINENDIVMQTPYADSLMIIVVATEYIYGNAIRDASGLLKVKDFPDTDDLNSISEELNKTVRSSVIPPFKKQVKLGDKIEINGAIELNKEHISFRKIEVIPVRLKILQ
jgi:predicted lipoprotein